MNSEVVHILKKGQDEWSFIKALTAEDGREDAFYVCDLGDLVKQHKNWLEKLPRVKPHYAIKCNDSPEMLKTLAALGTGFDCASKVEIQMVLEMGVHPNRIIYANPVKASSHLEFAKKKNVQVTTFDNEYELQNIKKTFPQAKLVLRIRYDAAEAALSFGEKFGCDAFTEAPTLLDQAKAMDLEVIGVSFHVGSDCKEPSAYYRAIAASRHVFDYGHSIGYQFHILDIGGGLPGDKDKSFDEIAGTVNAALKVYFPDPNIEVIAEPGMYFATTPYTLVCNVQSKKKIISSDKLEKLVYYINDGVYMSFICAYLTNDIYKPIPVKKHSCELYPSTVWGQTCDIFDKVADNIMLPELAVGDWVVFQNMGAYTISLNCNFNGFTKRSTHLVASEEIWDYLQRLLQDKKDFVAVQVGDLSQKN